MSPHCDILAASSWFPFPVAGATVSVSSDAILDHRIHVIVENQFGAHPLTDLFYGEVYSMR